MVCGEVFKNPIERKGAVPPQGARFRYYNHISLTSNKMDALDKTPGDSFFTHVKHRLMVYGKAVTTPHPNGPTWTVGKEFARLCEKESDLDVLIFGNFLFGSSLKWASDTLKAYRIKK